MPVKQLNVEISEDIHRQLKAKAALAGKTMSGTVAELIAAYVQGADA